MTISLVDIDLTFFYILWALALIPAVLQLNYLSLFFFSNLKKVSSSSKNSKKKSFPKVSILIPSYNEKFVIENTLKHLTKLKYPRDRLQLIVVDDSDDGTLEILEKEISRIKKLGIETKLIHRNERKGLKSGALNEGLKFVKGSYILALDADTIVSNDFLAKAIPYVLANPEKKCVNFNRDFYNENFNMLTRTHSLTSFIKNDISMRTFSIFKIPFCSFGSCLLIDAPFLEKIGGWKDNMIADDADVSYRIWMNGGMGEYVYNSTLFTIEADPSYSIWKQRVLRISKGMGQALTKNLKGILKSDLSIFQKIEFVLAGFAPIIGLFPLLFTFISFAGLVLSFQSVQKIFTSVSYIALSVFLDMFLLASVFLSMRIRKLSLKNYILPLAVSTFILGPLAIYHAIGFIEGLIDKKINFFKTPKFGDMKNFIDHYKPSILSKFGAVEIGFTIMSIAFILISIPRQLYYVTFISSFYLSLILLSSFLI